MPVGDARFSTTPAQMAAGKDEPNDVCTAIGRTTFNSWSATGTAEAYDPTIAIGSPIHQSSYCYRVPAKLRLVAWPIP